MLSEHSKCQKTKKEDLCKLVQTYVMCLTCKDLNSGFQLRLTCTLLPMTCLWLALTCTDLQMTYTNFQMTSNDLQCAFEETGNNNKITIKVIAKRLRFTDEALKNEQMKEKSTSKKLENYTWMNMRANNKEISIPTTVQWLFCWDLMSSFITFFW